MATLKSLILDSVHGSVKDVCFKTYNKYGMVYYSKKPKPSKTKSLMQARQRTAFSIAKTLWKTLTNEEKKQLEEEAKQYALTAYQYYMKTMLSILMQNTELTLKITNNSTTENIYYSVLKIDINNDSNFFLNALNDDTTIEIYDKETNTETNFFVEKWDTVTASATIYILVDQINAQQTKEYIIKFNKERIIQASDANRTFDYYETFKNYSKVKTIDGKYGWATTEEQGSTSTAIKTDGYTRYLSIKTVEKNLTAYKNYNFERNGKALIIKACLPETHSAKYVAIADQFDSFTAMPHDGYMIKICSQDNSQVEIYKFVNWQFSQLAAVYKSMEKLKDISFGILYDTDKVKLLINQQVVISVTDTTHGTLTKFGIGNEETGEILIKEIKIYKPCIIPYSYEITE